MNHNRNTPTAPADTSTPVLVLGGKENSLSIVRHLGGLGIAVSCSGGLDCWGMASRHCAGRYPVAPGKRPEDAWTDLLLGPDSPVAEGTILFPCSDEALRFVAENDDALRQRYVYDEAAPRQRLDMLDKQRTLELAEAAGVPAPRHWKVETAEELEALRGQITFPVMVKPIDSFAFARTFGCKLFIVKHDFNEVVEKVRLARSKDHAVMVTEMIPGPDELLSSYYTYIADDGHPLFHFTKRVWRRYPVNRGGATFHETQWLPETAAAGEWFFESCGFRGPGVIEFKRDPRDGQLKIIEVNARFTAAQELATRAGVPIDLVEYCHLTGQPLPETRGYREGLRYWYPLRDTLSCLSLIYRGELTLVRWIASLLPARIVSPLHSMADMAPSLFAARNAWKRAWR